MFGFPNSAFIMKIPALYFVFKIRAAESQVSTDKGGNILSMLPLLCYVGTYIIEDKIRKTVLSDNNDVDEAVGE